MTSTHEAGSYSVTFDTVVPHAELEPGGILKTLQQNISGSVTLLLNAFRTSPGAFAEAATDIVTTSAKRAVGVGAALAGNIVPITMAVIDAPREIGGAIADSALLLFDFLKKSDALGIVSGLKFAQKTIQDEINFQAENVVGAVGDLQHDILSALSAPLPGAGPSGAGGDPI